MGKKTKNLRGVLLSILFIGSSISSYSLGGIEILTNTTPYSIANPAQQSRVDPEAAYYNPAGLTFLEDGNYFYGGAYLVLTDYKTIINSASVNDDITTDSPQPIPSFSYIYKKDKMAYYFGLGIMGQGGFLTYDVNDLNRVNDLKVDLLYLGGIFGAAYQINDFTSISLGGRFVYSETDVDAKRANGDTFKSELKAFGIAPEIGIYSKITEKLSVGAKYLFDTKLDYDGDVKEGGIIGDTIFKKYYVDQRKDFPSIFSVGTTYILNEHQTISLGYNWIRESDKTIDEYEPYGDTFEYSISFKQYLNEKFDLTVGYSYVNKGPNDDEFVTITELDAQTFGASIAYRKSINTTISLGGGIVIYDSATSYGNLGSADGKVTSERQEVVLGVTATTKF